jgi:hypothetical protein
VAWAAPADWLSASVVRTAPRLQPGGKPGVSRTLGSGYPWWGPENPQGDLLAIGVRGSPLLSNPHARW